MPISSEETHAAYAAIASGAAPDNGTRAKNTTAVGALVRRLSAEVDAATKRVHLLRTEAAQAFVGQEERFMRFIALTDRIHAIFKPRLAALLTLSVFKDITQSVSLEPPSAEGRPFHGRTTTLRVPFSDACPAKVELSFRLGHDGPIENAILDYTLDILPIFIRFDSHDRLIFPIDNPGEDTIAAWIDDKLVGFTRTYFELSFTDQYQRQHLETDPVMNIRFPRAFATGQKEYKGRTYYFYTTESLEEFTRHATEYAVPAYE
jgi:YHS domain-containing protein